MSCIGARPPTAPDISIVKFPVESTLHSSGLRVVTEQAPDYGVAAAALIVGSGSAADPQGKAGLAHLVEHLVFRSQRGGASLYARLEKVGSSTHNGMTSWDETTYIAAVQKDALAKLLELWADTLRDPLKGIGRSEFEHELQIVRNEARLRSENGRDGQALSWLTPLVFPNAHPYSHPVGGIQETLSNITLDDARAFAQAHYRPDNTTLVVTSPLRAKDSSKAATEVLAPFPARANVANRVSLEPNDEPPPERPKTKLVTHVAPIPAPTLWLGWSLPSGYSKTGRFLELLSDLANGSYWGSVERWDADVARVQPGYIKGVRASLFYLEVPLKHAKDPEPVARRVIDQLRNGIADRVYDYTWFDLYRQQVAVRSTYAEESLVNRLMRMGLSTLHTGSPFFLREEGALAGAVENAQVAEFFKSYLTEERAHAVLVRPATQGAATVGPVGVGTFDRFSDAVPDRLSPSEQSALMQPLNLDELREAELENGLRISVLPRRGSPFHTAVLAFHGGEAHGVAGASRASLWGRRYTSFPASQRGLLASRRITQDLTMETVRATGSDVRLTLEQLRKEIDYSIRWPPRRFTEQLELFKKEEADPPVLLQRKLREALYGEHPYGVWLTAEQMRRVSAADVQRWVDSVYRPKNAILIVVGDVSFEQALAAARSEFNSFVETGQNPLSVSNVPPLTRAAGEAGSRVVIQQRPGTTQAELTLACVLPGSSSAQSIQARLFAHWAESWLLDQLRQHTGVSYHVSSDLRIQRGGTVTLSLSADAEYARLDTALGAVQRLLRAPVGSLIDRTSFERTRAAIARAHNLSFSTTVSLANALSELWNNGWSFNELSHFEARLIAARPQNLHPVAEHCRQNWALGLLGDEARLSSAWSRVHAGQPRREEQARAEAPEISSH